MKRVARMAALGFAAPLAYSLVEPYRMVVRPFTVRMEGLSPRLDGLRIAQISDLHRSAITPQSVVRSAVRLCNSLQPDVVVLTGDYVSRRVSYSSYTFAKRWARPIMEYAEELAEDLKELRAPHGVYAVPGNHDRADGNYDYIGDLLQSVGIESLVNRHIMIRGELPLIGIDDVRAGEPLVRQACAGVDADTPQVVLSHNPRMIWRFIERNALMLAGHTHGGQVHLPGNFLRHQPRDMRCSDLYEGWYREGRARLYVSVGTGSVHFPMRLCCPPEVPIFTLRAPV